MEFFPEFTIGKPILSLWKLGSTGAGRVKDYDYEQDYD